MTTHGHTRGNRFTPEYQAWVGAKARTTNPNISQWANYGGRGIRMAPEWLNDFAAFLAHVGPRPGPGYSLDRIDVDGDYAPGNVRWATQSEQMQNLRPRSPEHAAALRAASAQAARTHCPNGHPYAGHNLILRRRGGRDCRACTYARQVAYRQRRAKACFPDGGLTDEQRREVLDALVAEQTAAAL